MPGFFFYWRLAMKRLLCCLALLGLMAVVVGCGDDNKKPPSQAKPEGKPVGPDGAGGPPAPPPLPPK